MTCSATITPCSALLESLSVLDCSAHSSWHELTVLRLMQTRFSRIRAPGPLESGHPWGGAFEHLKSRYRLLDVGRWRVIMGPPPTNSQYTDENDFDQFHLTSIF